MFDDRIPVQICGQNYEILGNPAEALYYNSLARFVEEKMKEIGNSTTIVSSQKIAVLAALNIADELYREKENKTYSGSSLDARHENLIKLLDAALDEKTGREASQEGELILNSSRE